MRFLSCQCASTVLSCDQVNLNRYLALVKNMRRPTLIVNRLWNCIYTKLCLRGLGGIRIRDIVIKTNCERIANVGTAPCTFYERHNLSGCAGWTYRISPYIVEQAHEAQWKYRTGAMGTEETRIENSMSATIVARDDICDPKSLFIRCCYAHDRS